jgi:hypothetical protein
MRVNFFEIGAHGLGALLLTPKTASCACARLLSTVGGWEAQLGQPVAHVETCVPPFTSFPSSAIGLSQGTYQRNLAL